MTESSFFPCNFAQVSDIFISFAVYTTQSKMIILFTFIDIMKTVWKSFMRFETIMKGKWRIYAVFLSFLKHVLHTIKYNLIFSNISVIIEKKH